MTQSHLFARITVMWLAVLFVSVVVLIVETANVLVYGFESWTGLADDA